jgi:hypothetical protein
VGRGRGARRGRRPDGRLPDQLEREGRHVLLRPRLRAERRRLGVRRAATVDCPMNSGRGQRAVLLQGRLQAERRLQPVRARSTRAARSTAVGRGASRPASATPGFEGTPNAADGKCEAVASDCPDQRPPRVARPGDAGQLHLRLQRELRGRRQRRLRGHAGHLRQRVVLRPLRRRHADLLRDRASTTRSSDVDCAADGWSAGSSTASSASTASTRRAWPPASTCDADGYQQCDDSVPFCVSEEDEPEGFCSHECKAKSECAGQPGARRTRSTAARPCPTAPARA